MVAELVGEPGAVALNQRLYRQLHEIGPGGDVFVKQAERGRIDHVLGIMEHHHRETASRAPLVGHQRAVEAVEAIGLGARPVAIMDHQPEARITLGSGRGGCERRGIVAIAADIEPQQRMRPAGEQVGDGIADHRRFVPGRNDDGRRSVERTVHQRGALAGIGLGPACQPEPQPDAIDCKIIGRTDQEKDPGEQQ